MEQLHKCLEITFRKIIDASFIRAHLLTGNTEGILIGNQQKSQIILPQVFIERIIRRYLKQVLDLGKGSGNQFLPGLALVVCLPDDVGQFHQNAILRHIAVNE